MQAVKAQYNMDISEVRYQRSPLQPLYELKETFHWGSFIRYIEFGDDGFALRQVDEYENGNLLRYDRIAWEDQFGSLADFRYGKTWKKHWGAPLVIPREEFELKWAQAGATETMKYKRRLPKGPPPWIELFESGKWQGQP